MENKYYKYIDMSDSQKPYGKKANVCMDNYRLNIAEEQLKKAKNKDKINFKKQVIDLTSNFLVKLGYWEEMDIKNQKYQIEYTKKDKSEIDYSKDKNYEIITSNRLPDYNNRIVDIDYKNICNKYNLNNEKHIIWMKFTKDNILGVVARSNDINFQIPKNDNDDLAHYNTSGIILYKLGQRQQWDESFVLIFPIPQAGNGEMNDIECAIGQYLIENGIPILDFYSHTY